MGSKQEKRVFTTSLRVAGSEQVKAPKGAFLPVRVNLVGGWTDQLYWEWPAAVVNVAVGWEGCYDGAYPFQISRQHDGKIKVSSRVPGIGTGLGISSILEGGKYLLENPTGDFVGHTLQWEWDEGTKGGWQDQVGGIMPGMKLIQTPDHHDFTIDYRDDHPVLDRIVLFDTDIRRRSGNVGDIVRLLIKYEPKFVDYLSSVVDRAESAFRGDADEMIDLCLESWAKLNEFIGEYFRMDVPIPRLSGVAGYMLCGAGGGGYGVVFAKNAADRSRIVSDLEREGLWATVPEVLGGINFF